MSLLLQFAKAVDALSAQLAKWGAWTVLAAALVSAGNAVVRYGLDASSNGWLEIQWYLFAAGVMLGAPYVLKVNEHVRVDIFYGRLQGKAPVWLDLFGLIFFLLPTMGFLAYISTPFSSSGSSAVKPPQMSVAWCVGPWLCCCRWALVWCFCRVWLKSSNGWLFCTTPKRWVRN